jgi:hypothetical protein
MANNGGDAGKTLEQLGSEQSIKGLLTTMVTAGALQELNNSISFNGQSGPAASGINAISTNQLPELFEQNLLRNITSNVAGNAIDAAINGKPLDEKTLSTAISGALASAGLATGANAIGDAASAKDGNPAQIDSFTQKVAHAVMGCAGGAVTSGDGSGCTAGAVGAVIGELAAQYASESGISDQDALNVAKVLAAASGLLVGAQEITPPQ